MGLVKAVITNKDRGERLTCLFSPAEYTIAKSNSWQPRNTTARNVPKMDFTGGGARSMTMDLFFDTYEAPNHNAGDTATSGDVRTYIDKLWKLMMIDETLRNPTTQQGRPPLVTFEWGQSWSFTAVIVSMSVRYVLFREDGTPVRAIASVTFQEASDDALQPGTNPTSQAEPGYKKRQTRPGDTLARIAYEEYGNSAHWRKIADANRLTNPLVLPDVLSIPPLK